MLPFFLALFSLILPAKSPAALSFSFDQSAEEWGIWGEGIGSYQKDVGRNGPGSLWLSTDYGETHTAHYHWSRLSPGNYRVRAHVRAQKVHQGDEGTSFWHFYDGGEGTKSVFTDLHGSYEFRRVEYVLKVLKNDLSIWFRLKSPGQVWIDDISLEKTTGHEMEAQFSDPVPLKNSNKKVKEIPRTPKRAAIRGPQGNLYSRKYYDFNVRQVSSGNWSAFDRIEMDVFNGTQELFPFYLTIGDEGSVNYWSQLNHKTHLAPGNNHLSFDLRQFLGERGSHRFHRPLDLEKIRKMFIVVDPDGKLPLNMKLSVSNVVLLALPPPEVPKGVWAFDFTSHRAQGQSSFTRITTQDDYDPETGHGLVSAKFWRVEDSVYAPENLRYSIGIKSGKFRVDLPNGKYRFALVMERLGLWDPSFWKNRRLAVNGETVFMESRSNAREYLKDLLRFETVTPEEGDHPFDLYLSRVFAPLERTVNVTNRKLELELEGDPTGVSLNTLVIWRVQDEKIARDFLRRQKERERLEFDWIGRKISAPGLPKKNNGPTLVAPELTLTPSSDPTPIGEKIEMMGGEGERPFQLIRIPEAKDIVLSVSELKSKEGKVFPPAAVGINELVYQFTSADSNHETYMMIGKYFRPLKSGRSTHSRAMTRYYSLQALLRSGLPSGVFLGELTIESGKEKTVFPISLTVMSHRAPMIDFPVGFFGLDPIPFTYFDDPGIAPLRQEYRLKTLQKIAESGFTTYTGLPSAKLDESDLDTSELDELFMTAAKYGLNGPVFSYGGQFPNDLLKREEEFQGGHQEVLRKVLSRPFWPKIVHTFSDEAGGYSNRIHEDLEKGRQLRRAYPFLALGGFSSMANKEAMELNRLFDYGLYSSLRGAPNLKGQQWGSYNASPGNLHDPRFTMGPGLFLAREKGLGAYLEWHLVGFNNYPYYELDGREGDVFMLIPSLSGELYPSLRFELATEGIQSLRKLLLLQELLHRNEGSERYLLEARKWLLALKEKNRFLQDDNFLRGANQDFPRFHRELNQHLLNILEGP